MSQMLKWAVPSMIGIGGLLNMANAQQVPVDYQSIYARTIAGTSREGEVYSIRDDVSSTETAAELKKLRPGKLRPISVSAELLENLDQKKRFDFFKRWKELAK